MKPLVIVRAEPAASATATAARRSGLEPIVMPLFVIEPVEWTAPDPATHDALLLTSANALRFGGAKLERLTRLAAHCVGEATARAARDAGFTLASVGTGGVDALLAEIAPDLRLLHLCGADRRVPSEARQAVTPVPVYRAVEIDPPDGFGSLRDAVIAVHSPRSAATLARMAVALGLARETIAIAAISQAAAEAAGAGWKSVVHSPEPSDCALLALAAKLCNKPG